MYAFVSGLYESGGIQAGTQCLKNKNIVPIRWPDSQCQKTVAVQFNNVKNSNQKTSGHGAKQRFYTWDNLHDDIEVYNRWGKHLGSMDPVTGEMYKPSVTGRSLE